MLTLRPVSLKGSADWKRLRGIAVSKSKEQSEGGKRLGREAGKVGGWEGGKLGGWEVRKQGSWEAGRLGR